MYSIHHVALSVTDRATSVLFYEKLGFEQVHLWEAEDGSLSITHVRLHDFILELFCYKDFKSAPDTTRSTATDLPVIGTKHFGLQVDSIEAARTDLAAKGIVDENIAISQGRTGPRYFFVEDPDGILVEIMEDKRQLQPQAPSIHENQSQEQLSSLLVKAAQQITVGGRYMHYKQLNYKVLSLALREEDNEPCVVYQAEYGTHSTWIRPVTSWLEEVAVDGKKTKRFTPLDTVAADIIKESQE